MTTNNSNFIEEMHNFQRHFIVLVSRRAGRTLMAISLIISDLRRSRAVLTQVLFHCFFTCVLDQAGSKEGRGIYYPSFRWFNFRSGRIRTKNQDVHRSHEQKIFCANNYPRSLACTTDKSCSTSSQSPKIAWFNRQSTNIGVKGDVWTFLIG